MITFYCSSCAVKFARIRELEAENAKMKADLDAAEARIAKLEEALRKIAPIRVENGPDYAEVFFSDGVTHSTRAMTRNPQDWIDLSTIIGGESDD